MSFAKILEKKGKDVTLKKVTKTYEDDLYKTVTENTTEVQVKAIILGTTFGKEILPEGYEADGKLIAYVATDVDVSTDDDLVFDSIEYRIVKISKTDAYVKLEAIPK